MDQEQLNGWIPSISRAEELRDVDRELLWLPVGLGVDLGKVRCAEGPPSARAR